MSEPIMGRGGVPPATPPPSLVDGVVASWLSSRREHLNERFEKARRRTPSLEPDEVLQRLVTALPPLAGPEVATTRLLDVVYDLVLLHAGRGAFARHPGLGVLLDEALPALRPFLLEAPGTLPGALSNAVENLGERGEAWARALPAIAATLPEPDPDVLLAAGAVLAWRLGDARLRATALTRARTLPLPTVRAALDLPDGADVVSVLERLSVDAWNDPLVPTDTSWRRVATIGGFSGFGGPFDAPPRVLDGGQPHVLHVASAGRFYRVEADRYGHHVRPEPDPGLRVREARKAGLLDRLTSRGEWADPDGTFHIAEGKLAIPQEAGLDTWVRVGHVLAVARRDSHELRVYATAPA